MGLYTSTLISQRNFVTNMTNYDFWEVLYSEGSISAIRSSVPSLNEVGLRLTQAVESLVPGSLTALFHSL